MAGHNYYIGIGGTGARIAEALVHLCAAGLGPKQLKIFLIDPDQGNGNLGRTAKLIRDYEQARTAFRERANSVEFLHTEILAPDTFIWSILKDQSLRLNQHIRLTSQSREFQDFVRVLFSDEELDTPLSEGFRGHPNIGAAILADSRGKMEDEPWKTFWADVVNSQAHGTRVFLGGSIFGGTGAAGIPTLSNPNFIKEHPDAQIGDSSKVRLGAALVMPYFTFDVGTTTGPQMFVTSEDFPIATKAALHYYLGKQQKAELAIDDMYLIGDSLEQNVGGFSPGSVNQNNRPHYIEMVSALAALDFYRAPKKDDRRRRYIAARETPGVGWEDLPVSRDLNGIAVHQGLLRRRMMTLATFAYAMLDYGLPLLRSSELSGVPDAWHDEHFYPKKMFGIGRDRTRDPRHASSMGSLGAYESLLRQYLEWVAALDEGPDGPVKLIDKGRLFDDDGKLRSHKEHPYTIGSIARDNGRGQDFTEFLNILNATHVEGDSMSPSDTFANLFYKASIAFAEQNYSLPPEPSPASMSQGVE